MKISTTIMKKYFAIFSLSFTLSLLLMYSLTVAVQAITHGYATSDTGLRAGMVVSLSGQKDGLSVVERSRIDSQDRVVGVVSNVADSLIAVTDSKAKVYVANEGTVVAYVSDINGMPRKGDLLSVSSLNGILMKAPEAATRVAIAEEDFTNAPSTVHPISGTAETAESAQVAKIKVNLDVKSVQAASGDASVLDKIGKSLTGKEVSDLRLVVALVVFFIVMLSEGAILYGAISSGLNALGRNPLAKNIIRSELFRVVGIALMVLFMGTLAIYALLWI